MGSIFDRSLRAGIRETAAGALPALWSCRWRSYGLALLLVAAAALVRGALPEVLGGTPYLAFYLAWVGAAAFGGLGPGLLATAASWLCVDLLFDTIPWQITFGDPAALGRMAFLLAGGTAVSLVAERMRRGRLFERRQANKVARAKQEWERTFDAVPDLISLVDREYRILRVNRAMAERLGVPPERCIGLTCYRCMHEFNAPPALCPHLKCRADGRAHTAEVGDERTGYFLVTCTPLVDPEGRWIGSVHVARDITERRQADQALRESEERLRAIFDRAGVGLAEAADDDRLIAANDRFCRILGYPRDELLGKTVHELTAPADRTASDTLNARLHEGQTDRIDYEKRYLRRDGTPVWVHVIVSTIHDVDGRWHRSIATIEDISERKQAETALRLSERQFKSTFENAAVGITHVGLDGRFLRFNDRFCEIIGYSHEGLAAQRFQTITHPDDLPAEIRLRQRLEHGEIDHYSLDKRYLRADGAIVWVSVTASVQRENDGPPEYFIAIVEDISRRKQMEEQLRDWNATLETKVAQRTAELQQRARQLQRLTLELSETEDRERRRMAEILHDDLQQVLAAAKFHVNLLHHRVRQDPPLEATAGQIDQMLKDAIDKSRSLSHELSPAVLHHGDLAETLRWLARQVQTKHGLAVRVHAPGPVHLPSDVLKGFLYKAAQELLFNVVKHARVQEARIRLRQRGRYLCLSVSDHGRGFDPQGLREAAGFGLLNIRERVEALGGRMRIRSAPGQGSRFLIVVPDEQKARDRRRTTEDGRKADEEAVSSILPSAASGPALRVLLADDHAIVRQGLASLLREADAVEIVGEATNGREAVNLADQLHPDVVIMDVSMPVMSGVEATRQIKKELPRTRIIALSMWEESEVREKMYRAGAEGYVLKTAPSEELLAAIRGPGPDAESTGSSHR